MIRIMMRITAAVSLAALFAGCGTVDSNRSGMMSQAEKSALADIGKPPQVFGLTAYTTPGGVIFGGGFRLHQGQAVKVNFASGRNTTTPMLRTERGSVFLVDSSAGESWITMDAAATEKTTPLLDTGLFEQYAAHVYDPAGGIAVVAPKMIIDELHLESSVFFMRQKYGPLETLTRWEQEPPIDGVLGADFLRAFKFVRISFKDRYIVLSATTAYPETDRQIAAIPLVKSDRGLVTEAVINGTRELALIDIAGDFEVAMDTTSDTMLRQVSIGDVVFRQVEAIPGRDLGLGLEPQPRIGRQLLEKFDIVLNEYGTQLILERP